MDRASRSSTFYASYFLLALDRSSLEVNGVTVIGGSVFLKVSNASLPATKATHSARVHGNWVLRATRKATQRSWIGDSPSPYTVLTLSPSGLRFALRSSILVQVFRCSMPAYTMLNGTTYIS